MVKVRVATLSLAIAGIGACTVDRPTGTDAHEEAAVLEASNAYFDAWLKNDPTAVMSTFVEAPVLSPSGLPFVEGREAAESFWWPPDGPPTSVTGFAPDASEVGVSGTLGYVRGTFVLEFELAGETHSNAGKYIHLLRKVPDTGWKISHSFWDDVATQAP